MDYCPLVNGYKLKDLFWPPWSFLYNNNRMSLCNERSIPEPEPYTRQLNVNVSVCTPTSHWLI